MNKILKITLREYAETVKTKTFILGILMAPLIVAGIIFFTGRMTKKTTQSRPAFKLRVTDMTGQLSEDIKAGIDKYNESHPNKQIQLTELNTTDVEDQGKTSLREGKIDVFAVLDPNIIREHGTLHLYTHNPKASDLDMHGSVEHILRQSVVNVRCRDLGISSEQLSKTWYVPVKTVEVGKTDSQQKVQKESDKMMKMMVPFCFMYLMFMGMIGTGQHMLSSVIEEKGSRVIEVLLSAVSPFQLMAGKIIGLAGIGITVVGIWGAAAYGAASYKGFIIDVSPTMLFYFVIYFIPGFLLFTSLLAGVGSICNTIKETQGLMMPIMMIFILPLLSWFKLVQEPGGLLARVLSFVPPLTPLVMILRISADDNISIIEIILSLIVLMLGVIVTMWAATKIFRTGILMYGKRPGLREIIRWVRQA